MRLRPDWVQELTVTALPRPTVAGFARVASWRMERKMKGNGGKEERNERKEGENQGRGRDYAGGTVTPTILHGDGVPHFYPAKCVRSIVARWCWLVVKATVKVHVKPHSSYSNTRCHATFLSHVSSSMFIKFHPRIRSMQPAMPY